MSSRAPAIVGLVGLVLCATTALADAPGDQYDTFNQFDTQISDRFTRLAWQRQVAFSGNWGDAQRYCATLDLTQGFGCGWRVPSYKELLTLVDENPHGEYDSVSGQFVTKWIDPHAFLGTPVDKPYWTSSPSTQANRAWTVDFSSGIGATDNVTAPYYVRCVHDP